MILGQKADVDERHDGRGRVTVKDDGDLVRPDGRLLVLKAVPGGGQPVCGRLSQASDVAGGRKDNSSNRGTDVNDNAVRHSGRRQTGAIDSTHREVVATTFLHAGS